MRQLRLAFRTIFKAPLLTAVAVLSLALGIGANTAIFSLTYDLLVRTVAVPAPEELVNLSAPGPKPGATSCGAAGDCDQVFSYPMFRDLERAQDAITGIAAHVLFGANVGHAGETTNMQGVFVSGSYFPVLRLTPVVGRLFTTDDDRAIGEPHTVVLSHDFWVRRFASNPAVVGERIVVNGQPLTVIGVAPRGFRGTTTMIGNWPQIFVPVTMRRVLQPSFDGFDNRRSYWAYLFARLRPGVSIESARQSLDATYRPIINEAEAPLQKEMSAETMARFRARSIGVEPGAKGQSDVHREAAAPLILLFSLTGVVLLIACGNVANLLLARAAGRTTEVAVRLAVGASRRHIVGQLLLESCLLFIMGGAAGLAIASLLTGALSTMMPAQATEGLTFRLNTPVLLFSTSISLVCGLLFGLFPALHSTRPDLAVALRQQAGQPGGPRVASRFRTALVVAQIALSTALLIVAGLLTKSLSNVGNVDLGFRPERVLTFMVSPRLNGYTAEATRAFVERAVARIAALPGVTGVTTSSVALLAGNNWGVGLFVQGFDAGLDTDVGVSANYVSPGFFRTLGGRILAGREFTDADKLGAPRVAIINEAAARKFNLGTDVVGRRAGRDTRNTFDIEIVGLAADMKYSEVKDEVPPQVYFPAAQDPLGSSATFYVRTAGAPEAIVSGVRQAMSELDPNLPLVRLRPMPVHIADNIFAERLVSTLSASFAALATLLAAVGLYGVLAYAVSQRTREFGLRMALGAGPGGVRRLVLRQVGWMAGVGGAIGLLVAAAAGRLLAAQLFGVDPYDATVLVTAVVALMSVAFLAGFVPALRASRVDPMRALRYE